MPIRREFRQFYGREWREVTRPRILKRAGNRCEQCGVPNNTDVTRAAGWWVEWIVDWHKGAKFHWRDDHGAIRKSSEVADVLDAPTRLVRIVLTIAHMNHTPGDDRDENLKALCQYHHLHYDAGHHAETRQVRKDAARPLLQESHP